jgi:hypothetical protein
MARDGGRPSTTTMKPFACFVLFIIGAFFRAAVDGAAFVDHPYLHRPPIGATYEKSIGIPVLGHQVFSLHILSDNTAHLLVKGVLFLDEIVAYTVASGGALHCRLSDDAIRRLKNVRATLKEVGYCGETDTPYVKVSTPLPLPVKIHLKRKNAAVSERFALSEREKGVVPDDDNECDLILPLQ